MKRSSKPSRIRIVLENIFKAKRTASENITIVNSTHDTVVMMHPRLVLEAVSRCCCRFDSALVNMVVQASDSDNHRSNTLKAVIFHVI
jgi:hypothetical protein